MFIGKEANREFVYMPTTRIVQSNEKSKPQIREKSTQKVWFHAGKIQFCRFVRLTVQVAEYLYCSGEQKFHFVRTTVDFLFKWLYHVNKKPGSDRVKKTKKQVKEGKHYA